MPKYRILTVSIVVLLVVFSMGCGSESLRYRTAKAVRHEIKLVVSTNGIIEPVDRSEVYAPIDGLVTEIPILEGSEIAQGQLLMRLRSEQTWTALAETKTALLEAMLQAKIVTSGPSKEEITALDAAIAETAMQLDQADKDLIDEENLLAKGAVARAAVENIRQQRDLLQLRLGSQRQQKADLLERYSAEEKQWVQDKVKELTGQVHRMEQQLKMESIPAPKSGLIYSLEVKPGAYVTKGQLVAQINQPGKVRLRAYVDEPDLGRISRGQPVSIEWDGMADRHWTGRVERPAEQVVELNNRSVGYVLCSIEGEPKELIPNLNVNVEITTDLKPNVLTVPRSAVLNRDGEKVVLVPEGEKAAVKPVVVGLVTSEEIEILQGIDEGDSVVLNPHDASM
ncbi:MAG: efflux RND transporter periplasmic adaptor subunit [Acidobacteria bacterium]|nr:efflux RND transporter periplasmic adaptor subunit [Acidobacteriota bacterium]